MNLLDIDITILRFFNQPFSPIINMLFVFIIFSVYIFLIFLIYSAFKRKEKEKLIHLIIASVIGIIFVYMLKYSIDRSRPYETYSNINKILTKSDPSFPSAHTFIAFFCLSFLPTGIPKWFKYLSMLYLLILIPVGSMYIGVHYPSDVLTGAFVGIIIPKILNSKRSNQLAKVLSERFFHRLGL